MEDLHEHDEARWIAAERVRVLAYLEAEGVDHGGVPDEPAWFLAPYLAIWPIGSRVRAGATGWWAISGDVPADYLSNSSAATAREALGVFADQWKRTAGEMIDGVESESVSIGNDENRAELGERLLRRAEMIGTWVADDGLW